MATEFTGEIHPLADELPMLPADELAELAQDIAANGLTDPLTLDAEGRLEIPDVTRAVRDAVVAIDKRRNTESNFRAILEGLNGETIVPLADDPYMNRAWVIGKGLRKLGMYLRIEDLDQIMSNKRQNVTSVVARYEDEAAAVDVIKARMRAGGFSEMGELRQ